MDLFLDLIMSLMQRDAQSWQSISDFANSFSSSVMLDSFSLQSILCQTGTVKLLHLFAKKLPSILYDFMKVTAVSSRV